MIKKISVRCYRKIHDRDFEFTPGVNVLSGTNGTCKTSLLHIISNSFQAPTKKSSLLKDVKCLEIFRQVNNITNPKIETLTKGDKQYNDPAIGNKGTLYDVEYQDNSSLSFRKHNSKSTNRFAIKPYYPKGKHDTLPIRPVVYLGLSRLFPFGEFQNDLDIKTLQKNFPNKYLEEISKLYKNFTYFEISSAIPQKNGRR